MKDATLKQASKILDLVKDVPCEQVQKVIASGLLSDLLNANVDAINRETFRQFVGLKRLPTQKTEKVEAPVCDSCGKTMVKVGSVYECSHLGCERHCRDFFGGCNFYAGQRSLFRFNYTGVCERCGSRDPKSSFVLRM